MIVLPCRNRMTVSAGPICGDLHDGSLGLQLMLQRGADTKPFATCMAIPPSLQNGHCMLLSRVVAPAACMQGGKCALAAGDCADQQEPLPYHSVCMCMHSRTA